MGGDPNAFGARAERVRGDGCHAPARASAARDHVSSHLYRFERKIVRDLAWALTSPHVVGDPERELAEMEPSAKRASCHPRVFPDEDAASLFTDSIPWLDALDADPTHLLDWIGSQRGSNKLGFYFGALVEYGVRFNPRLRAEAVTTHRQVARALGAGRMVGQLKLVFRTRRTVAHWEYNVKYFVDAGTCFAPRRVGSGSGPGSALDARLDETRETEAKRDASYVAESFATRVDREKDDLRDWRSRGVAPPPAGDSSYVGPFLHENLHIRVREATRKLALAKHPNVEAWLDRWASDALEGESIELTELGKRLAATEGGDATSGAAPSRAETRREKTSQQILRGYLFYPLRGDGRGGSATWRDTRARGTASDAHLRGWWVRTPEELLDVKAVNEASADATARARADDAWAAASDDDGSDGDGRMWALFTRKCHWLGPCVATHVPDASRRDGADTEWVVRGVPELNVRDIEVVPTSAVVAAARRVLELSDRGVLIAELVKTNAATTRDETRNGSRRDFEWRESSRGFVLPPDWNPWPTALRVDPFRRRYERTVADAGNASRDATYDERYGTVFGNPSAAPASAPAEVVFDEMYPDREDVEALGDDVRVGPRRVFKGAISWKTERDEKTVSSAQVRDWGSRDERRRRDASATCVGSLADKNASSEAAAPDRTADLADGGRASPRPGALAGASFARAASSENAVRKLLVAVKNAVDTEGSVVRPARPMLVRALAAVGGADKTGGGDDEARATRSVPVVDGFSGRSARDAEMRSTRALVESAVCGASACLAALDDVDDDVDDDGDGDDVDASTATRRFSMSTRRAVSHALLDALGPATRRNSCVGEAFAPHVSAVFAKCLGSESPASPASSFRKTGVCPRVAVRFAKILRVPPALALPFPGSAIELAEALVEAIATENARGRRSAPRAPDSPSATPDIAPTDSVPGGFSESEFEPNGDALEPAIASVARKRSALLAARSDAPASRAGAVAELLTWSGEGARASRALVERLADACVDAGHASAAEALTKTAETETAFSLRARLAQTHADAGNHRAARRLASESLVDELRGDAEESFAFYRVDGSRKGVETEGAASTASKASDDAVAPFGGTSETVGGVLESALGRRGRERVILANDAASLAAARVWLERALAAERSETDRESTRDGPAIVGFDCEWRPGPGDASINPVTVAQFAAGGSHRAASATTRARETETNDEPRNDADGPEETSFDRTRASAVVLDCAATLGPAAPAATADAATAFVRRAFSACLLVGFGVAGDARRLVASYPERFARDAPFENALTAATVCARDVAVTLGGSVHGDAASLSALCAATLGPGNELDKTEQTSRWDERPLRASQIRYAALDALAPRLALHALLEKRADRMFRGDVAKACRPWTRVHKLVVPVARDRDTGSSSAHHAELPPRTDADVRAALARLGALLTDDGAGDGDDDEDDDASRLRVVDGWRAWLADGAFGSSSSAPPLLCKTLAVVAERVGDGTIELAATCVLPAGDSARLDLVAAAEALGAGARDETGSVRHANVRLRLANEVELRRLFGFAPGSVGPFGLRDLEDVATTASVARASLMDESLVRGGETPSSKRLLGRATIAVGGGAPDVKVVGTARAVARHAEARIARIALRGGWGGETERAARESLGVDETIRETATLT